MMDEEEDEAMNQLLEGLLLSTVEWLAPTDGFLGKRTATAAGLSPSSRIIDGLILAQNSHSHLGTSEDTSGTWHSSSPLVSLLPESPQPLRLSASLVTQREAWENRVMTHIKAWWPLRPAGAITRTQWVQAEAECALLLLSVSSSPLSFLRGLWMSMTGLFDRVALSVMNTPSEALWVSLIVTIDTEAMRAGKEHGSDCIGSHVDRLFSEEIDRYLRKEKDGKSSSMQHVRRAVGLRRLRLLLLRSLLTTSLSTSGIRKALGCTTERSFLRAVSGCAVEGARKEERRALASHSPHLFLSLLHTLPDKIFSDVSYLECALWAFGGAFDKVAACLETLSASASPSRLPLSSCILLSAALCHIDTSMMTQFVQRFHVLILSFLCSVSALGEAGEGGGVGDNSQLLLWVKEHGRNPGSLPVVTAEYFIEALGALASSSAGRSLLFSRLPATPVGVAESEVEQGGDRIELSNVSLGCFWMAAVCGCESMAERQKAQEAFAAAISLLRDPKESGERGEAELRDLCSRLLPKALFRARRTECKRKRWLALSASACALFFLQALNDTAKCDSYVLFGVLSESLGALSSLLSVSTSSLQDEGAARDIVSCIYRSLEAAEIILFAKDQRGQKGRGKAEDFLGCLSGSGRLFSRLLPAFIAILPSVAVEDTGTSFSDSVILTVRKISALVLRLLFSHLSLSLPSGSPLVRFLPALRTKKDIGSGDGELSVSVMWLSLHMLLGVVQGYLTTCCYTVDAISFLLDRSDKMNVSFVASDGPTAEHEAVTSFLSSLLHLLSTSEAPQMQKKLLRLLGATMYYDSILSVLLSNTQPLPVLSRLLANRNATAVRRNAAIALGVLFPQACTLEEKGNPAALLLQAQRYRAALEAAVRDGAVAALLSQGVNASYTKESVIVSNCLEALAALLWPLEEGLGLEEGLLSSLRSLRASLVASAAHADSGILSCFVQERSLEYLVAEQSDAVEHLCSVLSFLLPSFHSSGQTAAGAALAVILTKLLVLPLPASLPVLMFALDLGCAACNYTKLLPSLARSKKLAEAARKLSASLAGHSDQQLIKRCARLQQKLRQSG